MGEAYAFAGNWAYTDVEEVIAIYSDVYKEKHGIRPRWDYERLRSLGLSGACAELTKLYDEPPTCD